MCGAVITMDMVHESEKSETAGHFHGTGGWSLSKRMVVMKNCLLIILLMSFLTDGDMLTKDTLDPGRTNIKSKSGDLKGWLKKDTLQPDKINVYDKYGNKKGWLEKDTLDPDTWRFREK